MRKYPSALFLSGVGYHLRHAVLFWLPIVGCFIAALCGVTVLYTVAAALFVGWILYAVGKEKIVADAYEAPDADPALIAAVEEEFKKRYEPER